MNIVNKGLAEKEVGFRRFQEVANGLRVVLPPGVDTNEQEKSGNATKSRLTIYSTFSFRQITLNWNKRGLKKQISASTVGTNG